MQGKPIAEILKTDASFVDEMVDADYWPDTDNMRAAAARLEAYEAALRDLVGACTTGDRYADGRPAGVRIPEREVLERARKALDDA